MTPDMELALSARAENIAVVRYALGGLGEAFAVPEPKLSDIRLAVTEACANVVVHAYPDGHYGPMEVVASKDEEALTVLVRDWGRGIGPRPDSPGLGLGLSLIAALADSVQLGHDDIEHTEVRMTFLLGGSQTSTNTLPGTSTVPGTGALQSSGALQGTGSLPGPGGRLT
ncbi:MAG TPA: ATP-binding protein [Solirubrobacteraceae bacterium]|jgi:serine/threonine-protein kinase RsbW|nr:ATP-binding protein [Solirubrobacteraceae bacterium]